MKAKTNAGRSRSPARRSRRKSPARRRKSPARRSRRKSPTRRSRRKSPARRSRRKSPARRKSPSRRKSPARRSNKDGTGENIVPGKKVGRFLIKSVISMSDYVKEELKKNDSKLNYSYNIDFTKTKEFNDILKSNSLIASKILLNKYIEMVKNYTLYPKKETENFKENYLKKLLILKEELDKNIPSLRIINKNKKRKKKPMDILERIEEEEYSVPLQPSLLRQSSYEDTPYLENGMELYKHKKDPNKKRIYWKDDRYFDIIDT